MVVMMTVGVGATTASFVAVDEVLLRDLPVTRQDELVVAWRASEITSLELPFSGTAFDAVATSAGSVSDVAAYSAWGALPILADGSDGSYSLSGTYVAGDFFGVLGARPAVGRLLTAEDDQPGADRVGVISYDVWRTRWAADPGVVGATLLVDGEPMTLVGVAPQGLEYPRGTEIWYRFEPSTHLLRSAARLRSSICWHEARPV